MAWVQFHMEKSMTANSFCMCHSLIRSDWNKISLKHLPHWTPENSHTNRTIPWNVCPFVLLQNTFKQRSMDTHSSSVYAMRSPSMVFIALYIENLPIHYYQYYYYYSTTNGKILLHGRKTSYSQPAFSKSVSDRSDWTASFQRKKRILAFLL